MGPVYEIVFDEPVTGRVERRLGALHRGLGLPHDSWSLAGRSDHGSSAVLGGQRTVAGIGLDDHDSGGVTGDCCPRDRKSTRLNSSHIGISYAVFCLKKKKTD